jgi:hypothetical protein
VSTWTKSTAMMPRAWAARNCFQAGLARRGAGLIPASCRICQTVDAAIRWPSLTSFPWTRRCPRVWFSAAMRITSLRTAAAVGGRPGRCRLCSPICALPADGARRAAPQVSPGTPVPAGGGEPIVTVRPARAGRLACNGLGRPGGARLRSRAGAPAAQHLWTTASVPAPSGSVRAVRQATGKLSVNPRQIVRVTSRCEGDRQPCGGLSDAGFLLATQVFMATGRSICTTTDIPDSGRRPESGRHGGVAARLVGPYLRWRWLVAAGHRGRPAPG